MNISVVRLNGGAAIVIHYLDRDQRRIPPSAPMEALCGRTPGGGTTTMGRRRSRWVGCVPDETVNCAKCLQIYKEKTE